MNHQTIKGINPDYDWQNEDAMDEQGIEDFIPVDATAWPVLQEWEFAHWGGSGDKWRESGKIAIYNGEAEQIYLEASINGVPFFSVLSSLDQWGTWHTFRSGGPSVRMQDDEPTEFIYAQEWGNPSFLESLGQALIRLAEESEPDAAKYREKGAKGIWRNRK